MRIGFFHVGHTHGFCTVYIHIYYIGLENSLRMGLDWTGSARIGLKWAHFGMAWRIRNGFALILASSLSFHYSTVHYDSGFWIWGLCAWGFVSLFEAFYEDVLVGSFWGGGVGANFLRGRLGRLWDLILQKRG